MGEDNRGPKERAYDEHISPLMLKIIELCKEHRINMASSFSLDFREDKSDVLRCTTLMQTDASDTIGMDLVERAERVFFGGPTVMLTVTNATNDRGNGGNGNG